jgi:hypothetical protein
VKVAKRLILLPRKEILEVEELPGGVQKRSIRHESDYLGVDRRDIRGAKVMTDYRDCAKVLVEAEPEVLAFLHQQSVAHFRVPAPESEEED